MVSKLDSAPAPVADGKEPGEARMPDSCVSEPTLASTWHAASSAGITDELLDWPPDVFALANVILARSEAFRFALSPIAEWPPASYPDWGRMVEEAGLCWGAWAEHRRGALPELVGQEWAALKDRVDVPLEHLAEGLEPRVCVPCSPREAGRCSRRQKCSSPSKSGSFTSPLDPAECGSLSASQYAA